MNHESSLTPETRASRTRLGLAHTIVPLAVCYALVVPPVFYYQGAAGLIAAGVAALVCAVASGSATLVAGRLSAAGQPIAATLIASGLRMMLPLAFCIAVGVERGTLLRAGTVWYLIGFYMIALAADTRHSLGLLKSVAPESKGR